ncbi:MAG TPA: DUF2461 family protein [Candidatus Methylomirabilis sp.]|nr:DUF2461 family protein [Candidatus Methylomirabilis sp.]
MEKGKSVFTRDTFRFFRDLARNNRKVWMDANRERYQQFVVQPFRQLLDELNPAILELDEQFDTTGRSGANFSRINRDIRFAKDKTPYRAQMYLKYSVPFPGDGETGQLYTGISANTVTVGFRVYAGSKRKQSALGLIADARINSHPSWLVQQKKKLGKRYESYWYTSEKGDWKQRDGWPADAEEWKKLQGWIVRRKMKPADGIKPTFPQAVAKIFREVYPLLRFTSLGE